MFNLRGSEWRRWDLHIHTPDTKKNDCYSGSNEGGERAFDLRKNKYRFIQ